MSDLDELEPTFLEQTDMDREDISFKEDDYLRKSGWVHTSSGNPCCFWLWNHKDHGFTGMSRSTAIDIQKVLDQQSAYEAYIKEHPDADVD